MDPTVVISSTSFMIRLLLQYTEMMIDDILSKFPCAEVDGFVDDTCYVKHEYSSSLFRLGSDSSTKMISILITTDIIVAVVTIFIILNVTY